MYQYRHALARMRQGDSDRDIARSKLMGRKKIAAVREAAQRHGWLDPGTPLPDDGPPTLGYYVLKLRKRL